MMDAGHLVDDATVLGIIRERLGSTDAANGFILDGYPRNAAQASELGDLLRAISAPLDAVLQLDVTAQILLRRLCGRRVCAACGQLLNIYTAVSSEIIDGRHSTDGGLLWQRPDDVEEVIYKRLQVYQDQTAPLIAHYGHAGVLRRIKADAEVSVVFESMRSTIESRRAKPVVRLE
jgi:adenylate kinase